MIAKEVDAKNYTSVSSNPVIWIRDIPLELIYSIPAPVPFTSRITLLYRRSNDCLLSLHHQISKYDGERLSEEKKWKQINLSTSVQNLRASMEGSKQWSNTLSDCTVSLSETPISPECLSTDSYFTACTIICRKAVKLVHKKRLLTVYGRKFFIMLLGNRYWQSTSLVVLLFELVKPHKW